MSHVVETKHKLLVDSVFGEEHADEQVPEPVTNLQPKEMPAKHVTPTASPTMLILENEFVLEKKLGEGAQGQVWRAVEKVNGKPFALKLATRVDDAMQREIDILVSLKDANCCDNVVKYFRQFTAQSITLKSVVYVIQMELIDGLDLFDWIAEKWNRVDEQLPADVVCKMLIDAFNGLKLLHQHGILHLDIKPENLMVRNEDNSIVIVDFGMACNKTIEDKRVGCASQLFVGTMVFLSPSRMANCYIPTGKCSIPIRQTSDVYAMALSFYDVLNNFPLGKMETKAKKKAKISKVFWLTTYADMLRDKVWTAGEIYHGDGSAKSAMIDALLRDALIADDETRPTAADIYNRAVAICDIPGVKK
jgi:serine/threonine protein kinase